MDPLDLLTRQLKHIVEGDRRGASIANCERFALPWVDGTQAFGRRLVRLTAQPAASQPTRPSASSNSIKNSRPELR